MSRIVVLVGNAPLVESLADDTFPDLPGIVAARTIVLPIPMLPGRLSTHETDTCRASRSRGGAGTARTQGVTGSRRASRKIG